MKRWRCGVAQEFVFEIQSAVVYNVDCFSTRIRPLLFSCNWMNEAIGDNKGVCIAAHLDKNLRARQRREMTTRSSMHLLLYLVSWMCMSINSTSCCLKSSAEAWCQWTNQEIPCSTFMCSSRMQIQLHKLTRYDRRESVRKTILLEIDDHDARFTDVTFNGILTRFDERCRAIASDLPCSRYREKHWKNCTCAKKYHSPTWDVHEAPLFCSASFFLGAGFPFLDGEWEWPPL